MKELLSHKPSKGRASIAAAVVFLLIAVGANCTVAQDYPSRHIRLVVPFPPGGTAELIARPLAQKLTEKLGQSVVVDNRPGATGTIGAGIVAKAPPDGYTLLLGTTNELCMSPGLYGKLPYDPAKDFAPVANIIRFYNVLVVNPSMGVDSVKEFINVVRKRQLAFSSSGPGSNNHLSAELFRSVVGVQINHVPYKGGGPAMLAVMSGEVQAMFAGLPPALSLIRSGKLKALFVTDTKRSPALPDVMSASEAGLPSVLVVTWNGVLAPAGTPHDVVDKLQDLIIEIVNTPEMTARIAAQGIELSTTSSEQFKVTIRNDCKKWFSIVKESGARAD